MITTAADVWDQTRSRLGLREGIVRWVKEPEEILEPVYKVQLQMAYLIPDTLASLVGILRDIHQFDADLSATGYSNAKQFTLPESCIRVLAVHVDLGAGYKECDRKQSDDIGKLGYPNYFDEPTVACPWAILIGSTIWIAPVASAVSELPVMLDRITRPDALTELDDPLQVSSVLREIIPHYVAWWLFTKKHISDLAMSEYAMFTSSWEQTTGVVWVEPREGHTPPEDQKTAQERA